MKNENSLGKVIGEINQGKSIPALQLVKDNPEIAALISKMLRPAAQQVSHFDLKNKNAQESLNQGQIQAISDNTKNRTEDNENILKLFPDIELAVQILISSILSPKDMVKTDLIFKARENIFTAELMMKLNQVIESHMESHYNIINELHEILRETLFQTGSYIKVVIPESIVDEIINENTAISTESLSELFTSESNIRPLGFLGAPRTGTATSMESFLHRTIDINYNSKIAVEDNGNTITIPHLEVNDNFKILKLPKLIELRNKQAAKALIRSEFQFAKENYNIPVQKERRLTPEQVSQMTYKQNPTQSQQFVVVPTKTNAKRKSVGRPLVMRLPSEAVIPVHVPGDETKHIGYFVLVDNDGNPVSRHLSSEMKDGLASALRSGGSGSNSITSSLIAKAKRNLANTDNPPTLDQITQVYGNIIESELMQRLSNGIYGENVKIGNSQEIYRIMLARTLSAKYTRLLYIPDELVTYFAFKFYPNGVGKSYLDDIKNLTSLRAILMFSKVMAMVKSAISLTHVGVTLDDKDPDPMKTIEMAQHEVVRMRQQYFPLGINSPTDLVDWIQRAGLEFSFEGHPGIPQTKFDFESKNIQHQVPDNELDEMLRKQTYMAFGLSPETVDNGFNSEFATTVVSNNILLSKRIIQLQTVFCRDLTDYVRTIAMNDSVIIRDLKGIMKDNKGLIEKALTDEEKALYSEDNNRFMSDMIDRFIDNLEVDLPKPDTTSLRTQSESYNEYSDALDKVIDSWISSEIVTSDLAGELSNNIDSIKAILKAHFLRRWMSENGYMNELNDIVTMDEDNNPNIDILDLSKNHIEGLLRSSIRFIKSLKPIKTATDSDLSALSVEPGEQDSGSSSDSDSSDGDGGDDDMGMDMGMDDDMGMGDDTGTDDAAADGAAPEDEPEDEPKPE
jgi:hypothetical protein